MFYFQSVQVFRSSVKRSKAKQTVSFPDGNTDKAAPYVYFILQKMILYKTYKYSYWRSWLYYGTHIQMA